MELKQLGSYIEYLFLIMAYVSSMCCLIRTDYNFAFALFGYYLWCSRYDKANSIMLCVLNGVLVVIDIIWLFAVGGVWSTNLTNNEVWNSLAGLHKFAIGLSVVNLILKVGLIGAIYMFYKKAYDQKPAQGSVPAN